MDMTARGMASENAANLASMSQEVEELQNTGVDTTVRANFDTFAGKNLYNQTAVPPSDGYTYNSSGVYTATATFATTGKIPCQAVTQYAFSVNGLAPIYAACFFNGETFISRSTVLAPSGTGVTFATPANCTHVAMNLFAVAHTTEQYTAAMAAAQLELGSAVTPFEAYNTEYLLKSSAYEKKEVVDDVENMLVNDFGKNMYNKTLAIDGKYINTSGVLSAAANSAFTGFVPVKPNTQYCLSVDMVQLERFTGTIYEFDVNGAYIKKTTYVYTGVIPFYTGSTTYYIAANFLMKAHITAEFNAVVDTIQLEYNATRTAYEAYSTKNKIDESYVANDHYKTRLSRLAGKKWLAFGTSLTWYNGQVYQEGAEGICQGYQSHVVKNAGLLLKNEGLSGSTITNVDANSLINRYTGFTYTDYDVVTIEYGGINDMGADAALGVIGDAANTTTYIGCLKTVIEYILTNSPTTKIILITSPDVNQAANNVPLYFKDYVDAMKAVAALYRLKVCDWFYESGINSFTKASLTIDGIHMNNAGNERNGYLLLKEFEAS
jgi:lysophospholipase L1-like esterase